MDKTKLDLKSYKNKKIEYNNSEIEINSFLTLSQIVFLIDNYLKIYFGTPDATTIDNIRYHYIDAELNTKNYILQLCTNVDVKDMNPDIYADIELWASITQEIKNYNYFRELLEKTVNDSKEAEKIENSLGTVVSNLVGKAEELLSKLSSTNPDDIKRAGEEGLKLMERLESTPIFNSADKTQIIENTFEAKKTNGATKKRTRSKKVK